MSRFASLGSGSRGNGTLVEIGGECILVDCGFTLRQAEARLKRLEIRPAELSAIVVTHEHSDHIGGVGALAYKYGIPVFASFGTLEAARTSAPILGRAVNAHEPFCIGEVQVQPVVVPHDAREPTQFVFRHADIAIGVISDLGCVTPFVIEQFSGLDGLLMESNYDETMLIRGRYPERVKRRIASELGHLSNDQSTAFLDAVANDDLKVVVGHVSEENNHPDLLDEAFRPRAERVGSLVFATQEDGAWWTELTDGDAPAGRVGQLAL
ncbi:MAG: MBL fold metallo-hydrolase [Pseudomonadales bacterium]